MQRSRFFLIYLILLTLPWKMVEAQETEASPLTGDIVLLGNVHEGGDRLNEIEIRIYEFNEVIHSVKTNWLGKFKLKGLERGKYYTLEVAHPDYITKRIGVNTELPEGVPTPPPFSFNMEVIEKAAISDTLYQKDIFDFPAGLVRYDKKTKAFDFNRKYTYDTMMDTSVLLYKANMQRAMEQKMKEEEKVDQRLSR